MTKNEQAIIIQFIGSFGWVAIPTDDHGAFKLVSTDPAAKSIKKIEGLEITTGDRKWVLGETIAEDVCVVTGTFREVM